MNPDPTSLDRLHDIVLPPPVSWWPPAPAWYWVGGALVLTVFVYSAQALLRWQRNRYRREALAEMKRLEPRLREEGKRFSALAELAQVVKRVALTAWPRTAVASLNGPAWLAFLNQTAGSFSFPPEVGKCLTEAIYHKRGTAGLDEQAQQQLLASVRHWVKHHHPLAENDKLHG